MVLEEVLNGLRGLIPEARGEWNIWGPMEAPRERLKSAKDTLTATWQGPEDLINDFNKKKLTNSGVDCDMALREREAVKVGRRGLVQKRNMRKYLRSRKKK